MKICYYCRSNLYQPDKKLSSWYSCLNCRYVCFNYNVDRLSHIYIYDKVIYKNKVYSLDYWKDPVVEILLPINGKNNSIIFERYSNYVNEIKLDYVFPFDQNTFRNKIKILKTFK